MASATKAILTRIRSVKNTKKITKAMEMVAASKVRKLVNHTIESRVYASHSWSLLKTVLRSLEKNPLAENRAEEKVLLVTVSSNRGLCGGYNAQVIRKVSTILKEEKDCDIISIGKKGDGAMRRMKANIVASFDIGEKIEVSEVLPIASMLTKQFLSGKYGKVVMVYTEYVSALVQNVKVSQVFPLELPKSNVSNKNQPDFLFEPDAEKVFEVIVQKIINTRIYSWLLESHASEESARMVAMKNASDAAGEMVSDLTLRFNKVRQAGITQEISEISAGMASIK